MSSPSDQQSDLDMRRLKNFVTDKLCNVQRAWLFTDLFNLVKAKIPGEEESIGLDVIKKRLVDDNFYSGIEECLKDLVTMYAKFSRYKKYIQRQLQLSEIAVLQMEFYINYVARMPKLLSNNRAKKTMSTVTDGRNGAKQCNPDQLPSSKERKAPVVPSPPLEPMPDPKVPVPSHDLTDNSEKGQPNAATESTSCKYATVKSAKEDSAMTKNLPEPKPAKSVTPGQNDEKKDDIKPMTHSEKIQLSYAVNSLPSEMLDTVVDIIRSMEPVFFNSTEHEFEVDFATLQPSTLQKLQAFVAVCGEAKQSAKAKNEKKPDARKGQEPKLGMKQELEKVLQEAVLKRGVAKSVEKKGVGKTGKKKGCGCGKGK